MEDIEPESGDGRSGVRAGFLERGGAAQRLGRAAGDRTGGTLPGAERAHRRRAAGPRDHWHYGPWGGTIDGDRLYGRGAMDMKGGLVAGMLAIAAISRRRESNGGER